VARKHGATRWQVCDWRRRRADGRDDRWGAAVSDDPCGASVTMIVPGAELKIYIATRSVDFRCGHDEIAAKVQAMLGLDPFSGAAFVFRSKRADRINILVWDRTGLVLVHERLEGCKFVAKDCGRRHADIAGDVRGIVRGPGLAVGPPGRSAASTDRWIIAAE